MTTTWAPGMTVRIRDGVTDPMQGAVVPGAEYRIEGRWADIAGRSWQVCDGNPACLHYAVRAADNGLPIDDNVLYGKIGYLGHLVHISEIEPLPEDEEGRSLPTPASAPSPSPARSPPLSAPSRSNGSPPPSTACPPSTPASSCKRGHAPP